MEKFKLSQHITLYPANAQANEGIPPEYQKDFYILYNAVKDKEYLLNPTIKYFIDKFSMPKTMEQVISEIRNDIKEENGDINETCSSFFYFLCKRKILIPEEEDETFALRKNLYKAGDTVDEYSITEVLANKKYLDVYAAFDNSNQTRCVIKLLNRKKVKDELVYEQELFELEREYTLLKKVEHIPAMCGAISFVKNDDHNACIVLEYIDGKPLFSFLEKTEGLTNSDLLRVIKSILAAFALLHESNIIHGDIHSSNILVLEDCTIKIIDLGLSRKVEVDKDELLPFGGVNYYMPPERIDTSSLRKYIKEPDLYSDVYQAGLLIYLVLYNDLPFDGFLWEDLSCNIKESSVAFPAESFKGAAVPESLKEIMKRCLKKNPEERYLNAGCIFEDFIKCSFAEKEIA